MTVYTTFQDSAAAAIPRPRLWRVALTLALTFGLMVATTMGAILLLEWAGAGAPGASPAGVVAFLAGLVAVPVALLIAARGVYRVPLSRFLTRTGRLSMRAFFAGAGAVAMLFGVVLLALWPFMPPAPGVPFGLWLVWLFPAALALLIQCGAEEMFFRGYLQTALAARFRAPALWLVAPAVLFGLLHLSPGIYGPNAWLIALSATLMGLVAGDVTVRTGSIAAAVGLHFANNAIGILLVATPGALDGLALARSTVGPENVAAMRGMILANIGLILVGYATYGVWMRRNMGLQSDGPDRNTQAARTRRSDVQ